MMRRQVPVVWAGTGPLSPSTLEEYAQSGRLILPNVLDEQCIEKLRSESELLADLAPQSTIFERDGRTVRSVFDVHNLSTYILENVVRSPRLLTVAEQILGSRVYLHQCHFNFKRPQVGGEFSWHSDFTFWYWEDGMPIPRAISMLLFLDEPRVETGPLLVAPGSHSWITHEHWERDVTDHAQAVMHDRVEEPGKNGLIDLDALRALTEARPIETVWVKPGDVLIMDANLAHASAPNLGCSSRRLLLLVYNSIDNRVGEPFSGQQRRPEYISCRSFTPL